MSKKNVILPSCPSSLLCCHTHLRNPPKDSCLPPKPPASRARKRGTFQGGGGRSHGFPTHLGSPRRSKTPQVIPQCKEGLLARTENPSKSTPDIPGAWGFDHKCHAKPVCLRPCRVPRGGILPCMAKNTVWRVARTGPLVWFQHHQTHPSGKRSPNAFRWRLARSNGMAPSSIAPGKAHDAHHRSM